MFRVEKSSALCFVELTAIRTRTTFRVETRKKHPETELAEAKKMIPKLNSDPVLLAAFGLALIVVSLALRFLAPQVQTSRSSSPTSANLS